MRVTATEFRKHLFPLLERVLKGETIEVAYKGAKVKLIPDQSPAKLARARRQNALRCDPDSIVHSDPNLLAEMEAEWKKDWTEL